MIEDEYKDLFPEQIDVIKHDEGNILVSASAGSGKTFTMIKRLIRLIKDNKAKVKEILAVTFTEAAAKEMKEKLAAAIEKAIEEGNTALADEAAELPYADVCTIDSFCARLLRLFFFKAGVSPDFSVADAAISDKLKAEAVNKTFSKFYENGDEDFKLLAKRFSSKRKDDAFKEIILSCYEYISTEEDLEEFKNKNLALYSTDGFKRVKDEYLKIVKNKLSAIKEDLEDLKGRLEDAGYNKGASKADGLISCIDEMMSLPSPYDLKNVEIKLCKFDSNPEEEVIILKEELERYKKVVDKIIEDAAKYFDDESKDFDKFSDLRFSTETVYKIIGKFTETYEELKAEENVLDFNDLERLSLKVLTDGSVAAVIKDKYKYVFIDEYQDVNGVQEAIINRIAKDNVFMVGDVKQSIYGFRGCRSDFFRKKFYNMENSGKAAKKLNRNFRSADAVINAVNGIFTYSMTDIIYGESYIKSKLVPGGQYPENSGRFGVYRFYKDEYDDDEVGAPASPVLPVYDILSVLKDFDANEKEIPKESRVIAKIITDEKKKTYYDPQTKTERNIDFRDIAILSRTGLDSVQDVIEGLVRLGVPVTSDGEVSVLIYPEIITLISLLKILCNFYDDVSLAAVMKSPFGNFTEEELTEIALSYYEKEKDKRVKFSDAVYNAQDLPEDLQKKVEDFIERINRARFISDFLPVGETLKRLIEENNYYAFLAAEDAGEFKIGRVKFFVRKAFECNCNSVSEFINLTKTAVDAFKTGGGIGGDAVKFTTIHASKGLEYPVVILRGAERSFANPQDLKDKILKDREFGLGVKFYDDEFMEVEETPLTGLIKARIKAEALTEEMRLFYVALTRAKNSLYVVFKKKKSEKPEEGKTRPLPKRRAVAESYVDFMSPDIDVVDMSEEDLSLNADKVSKREVLFSKSDKAVEDKMRAELGFKYPFFEDTKAPLKISVSAAMKSEMKSEETCVVKYFDYNDDSLDTERGITAHKIMELYDFDNFPDVKEFTKTLVANKVLTEEEVQKIDLDKISKAVRGGAFNFIKGKTLLREKNFIVNVEGKNVTDLNTSVPVLLQGKIDLLILDETGAYIIDYKYSSVSKDVLIKRYAKQLDLYAYAVEKSLNVKVKGKYIVSLMTGETVKID